MPHLARAATTGHAVVSFGRFREEEQGMTRLRFSIPLVIALLAIVAQASAQTTTGATGAINGRVSDTSDAVLPGVTVTIASASQMGIRETVTNDEGQYRFPAV